LVFIVLAVLFKRTRFYVASAWLVLIYSVFSIVYYSPDSYVYLMPALIPLAIWIGLGSGWVADILSKRGRYLKLVFEIGLIAFIIIHTILDIPKMDLSQDQTVERYVQTILSAAPPSAILFTEGDEATFALWYFHYAMHERPDVATVSVDLLEQPWYLNVLRDTYPELVIEDQADEQTIALDNPTRASCRLAADLQPTLDCAP
jgi:hypothetical protein